MTKNILLGFGILLIASCGGAKLLVPNQTDADRGAEMYTGYTLNDLNAGKTIYQNQCNKCHPLYQPSQFSEQKWNMITPKMVAKANGKAGKTVINQEQQELLLRYLQVMRTAVK